MNTTQLEERFEKIGIVPVVVLDDAKDAWQKRFVTAVFPALRLLSVQQPQRTLSGPLQKNIRICW